MNQPELVKVVSLIDIKLLQTKLFQDTHGPAEAHERLKCIQETRPYWCRNLDAAHEVNHEVNQLLPLVATDEYLYVLLDYEFKKREDPEGRVLITELFEHTEILHVLDKLRGAPDAATPPSEPKANRCRAEQLLKRLSEVRDEGWTYERALVRLKRNYLMFHAVIVLFFLVLLGVVIISAGGSLGPMPLR
jgi:hypothetical protein